jgi:hypothetical protein
MQQPNLKNPRQDFGPATVDQMCTCGRRDVLRRTHN